jgi:hypothetical protein
VGFKISKPTSIKLDSIEEFFKDIKSKKIHGPSSDQVDIWREYQKSALDSEDIALQLPTGGGKTLVGVGIAEWRRLKFNEKILILCPTRQLVNQVVEQSNEKYGIKVNGFTGSRRYYDHTAIAEYHSGDRVAVTTYSSLFNTNPTFNDANIIIFDDAHASEQYISKMWSLSIKNYESERPLYDSVVDVLKNAMQHNDYQRLINPDLEFRDINWVEKIPTPDLYELFPELTRVIDASLKVSDDLDEQKFTWKVLRDHLHACNLYVSAGEILLRPINPPTSTHHALVSAKQRIYMSATFGDAGELERITGRNNIQRINVAGSWDKQSIGRRYFLLPELSLSEGDQLDLCKQSFQKFKRSLVLAPDNQRANKFYDIAEELDFEVYEAKDIEQSKEGFIKSQNSIAIVTNRYDGIDFVDDECRLSVIEGLPRATNLQEQFLISKMGAIDVLNTRITTRLTQAFGRCTRSPNDFSAVIVRGEELSKYLLSPDKRGFLHPEIQAEIQFGIEQGKDATVESHLENIDLFLAQGEDWSGADDCIKSLRESCTKITAPGAEDLKITSGLENKYTEAIWNKNFVEAFDLAREIVSKLNEPKLRGYRCLWHYLAGSAAWLAYKSGDAGFDQKARDQYTQALKTEKSISWLVPLSKLAKVTEVDKPIKDVHAMSLIERLESRFNKLGTLKDQKFESEVAMIRERINQNQASLFEEGHKKLGEHLGFSAFNSSDSAAPDPWWIVNSSLCIVFEDHSEALETSTLDVKKARQAFSHPNWIKANVKELDADAKIVTVLITPVRKAEKEAIDNLADVYVWDLKDFRIWANKAISCIRGLRAEYPNSGDLMWRARASEKLEEYSISPEAIFDHNCKKGKEYFST